MPDIYDVIIDLEPPEDAARKLAAMCRGKDLLIQRADELASRQISKIEYLESIVEANKSGAEK